MANLVLLCHRHHWSVHEGGWKVVRAEDQRVGVPRFGGHERWSAYVGDYLTRRSVSGSVRTADCRRAGAERSTFRWLPSTPLDWPMVTGEGHVVVLENGGG
jgi:hypothetical protein